MDEIRSFEKANLFDLGHPRINRIADSFGQGSMGPPSENAGSKKHRFPNLRGWLTMLCNCNHEICTV
ncbi:BnaC08g47680D [Brassica napus]|uniref:BnaC08g47680D protein n=1 Tax=Brassica napus TaxID=3708 RepID=A0A078J5A9_BRANA|nr:BnaC08g47680D [Brassica napus]